MNNLNSILDYLKVFNNINKRPAYEPRTMVQEPRNMYAQGQLVRNTVDGSRPGYAGLSEGDVETLKNLYNKGVSHENIAVELDTVRMNVTRKINNLKDENILKERDILKVTKNSPKFLNKVENLRSILEKEIKEFNKNKILPKEKYTANLTELGKKMKISPRAVQNYLSEIKDLDFDVYEGSGRGAPTQLSTKDQNKFKKYYKTKTLAQMAREITEKDLNNKETKAIFGQLSRFRNILEKKGVINKKDSLIGKSEKTLGYKPAYAPGHPFRVYEEQQKKLAAKDSSIIKNKKYIKKSGEFSPRKLDTELLKFLNMDTIKGSLDLRFPKFLKPSFEHIQGITPGDIIGDSEALRKVDIMTRRYNFKEMGAKSNLYKDVKDYLRTAQAAIKNNVPNIADEALDVVNNIYTKIVERFPNFNRKDLPQYSIKDGIVKEINLKGLIEPRKVEDSFKTYFKNVADTTTVSELEKIKKIQPNAFKVIDLFQKGKINEGYSLIKSRMPSVKGGSKFAVPILAGGAAMNFLTSPAEAGETGVVDKAKSWPIEHPWLTGGAATGASKLTKADPLKYLRKAPRKILSSLGTPTGALAAWPLSAMGMKKAGWMEKDEPAFDIKSTGDRIGAEAELALAPSLVKWTDKLTKPIKNKAVRSAATQVLNLGMKLPTAMKVARIASPIGLLSLAGEGIYHAGKKEMDRRAQLSPKELADFHLERQSRGWSGEKGIMGLKKKKW